jgi:transposase
MVVEVGDFKRFEKAPKFAAFLGLVPSEDSSDQRINRYSITKAGNSHLRRLLIEAAQSYTRGTVGHKSIALKQRQQGNPPEVIAYADKANERLRRRFYKMTLNKGINRNVATTAVARELACFIWGMMTGCIGQ